MNLTVYNPDEHEEPEDSPIPEVREEVENIISFSAASPYMSIEEVAAILGKTEAEIIEAIHKLLIPALEINGEYRIIRKIFEGDRAAIDNFLRDD